MPLVLCSYVQWNMPLDASALRHAETAWVLATHSSKDLAWALTLEWVLSIHVAKTSTWVLTCCGGCYSNTGHMIQTHSDTDHAYTADLAVARASFIRF